VENSGKVAVAKVALRQRESLATLRVREGVFVLETMLWPDEVRKPDFTFLEEDVEVRPQELQMASSLIETMAGDFDPAQYEDAYREALQQLIEAKIEGKQIVAPQPEEEVQAAADLLSALRASVEAAKKGRPGDAAKGDSGAKKTAETKETRQAERRKGAKAKTKARTRKSA
jgi:DNA end-binding protein Ku